MTSNIDFTKVSPMKFGNESLLPKLHNKIKTNSILNTNLYPVEETVLKDLFDSTNESNVITFTFHLFFFEDLICSNRGICM